MTDAVSREIADLAARQTGWRQKLLEKGGTLANVITALEGAPEWQGVIAHDEFALQIMAVRSPPWLTGNNTPWTPQPWADADDIATAAWCQHHGIPATVEVAYKAVVGVARDNGFHPVRDYLDGLTWDGQARIETFTSRYFGAADSEYHRAIGRSILISAVARIFEPGCKLDTLPIFEGEQGTYKSTALRRLARPWFTDEIAQIGSKDASMQVQGVWLVELSELEAMSRQEIAKVKAFLSRSTDRFRPSYGRHVVTYPRQCVLVGTTNGDSYLKDETGARRFWPIRCGIIDVEAIEADRDMLWAEALNQYRAGARWWLEGPRLVGMAKEEQDARYDTDAWTDAIVTHLAKLLKRGETETSVPEILLDVISLPRERWEDRHQKRVGKILRRQPGWLRFQKRIDGKQHWKYRWTGDTGYTDGELNLFPSRR